MENLVLVIHRISKAKIKLEDGFKVTILLNSGIEINVMTRKVIKDASLAIQHSPKLEWISHTRHSRLFISFYDNVEMAIGGLKTRYPIFVVETKDHNLALE